jgi:hypothetical protein
VAAKNSNTPWWAKVSPDYYKRPSDLAAQLAPRARHYAAVLADTHLREEPQIAAAFLNGNVPYSLAQRAARQYQVVKDQAAVNTLNKAGMPGQVTAQQKASTGPPAVPVPPENTASIWGDASNPWDAFVHATTTLFGGYDQLAAQLPGVPTTDSILQGAKAVPKKILEGGAFAWSPVQVPVSQTMANQRQIADPAALEAAGRDFAGPVGGAIGGALGGAINAAGPALTNLPFVGQDFLDPNQKADMQRSGYDPNSWASRYAWYFEGMDAGQRAVAEADVRQLKQKYDPEKVDAVREIITSNFLNDSKIEALSPSSQAFIQGLAENDGKNADPKDAELFEAFNHAAGTHPGSIIARALGQDVGSQANQITSALGDLAIYWYLDPFAAGMKGVQAARLQRMVPAGSAAALENKIVATVDGTVTGKPYSVLGRNMDELTDSVDQVHSLLTTKWTTNEAKARALNEAGKIYGQFALKHPDMVNQWGFVAQFKAGKAEFIKPKTGAEMDVAKAKAAKGEEFEPYWIKYNDKPSKPGYALDRSSPEALQRSLNETRADLTSRMSEWMFLNAYTQGRPIIKGTIMMPGEVAFNRKIRAAIAPARDALVGSNNKILKYLNDSPRAANNIHFNGDLDKQADLFLGRTDGQWVKANYTTKWSATFEKIASKIGMTYSDRDLVFTAPESLSTFERMGLGHLPRRMAQVIAVNYAKAGPAERRMMAEQWQNMLAEAANFKNTPLAREVYEVLTKGQKTINGANPWSFSPAEAYVANRASNEILVGDSKIAAGVWDYQMADRMRTPNFRVISAMQKRTGVLSGVTGLFNARILNGPTAVWKVGKVGNPANMGRQALEAYGLLLADQGVGAFLGALNARRTVANATVADRLEANETAKAANKISEATTGRPKLQRELNDLSRSGDVVAYRQKLVDIARSEGFAPEEVGVLATLAEGVKVEDLMRLSGSGKLAVALGGLLSPLRRIRLVAADRVADAVPGLRRPGDVPISPAWEQWSDQHLVDGLFRYAMGEFGHASDNAISLAGQSVAQELASAAKLGVGGRPASLPNARDWLGTSGDAGAINWFKELDSRQSDKMGEILRAVAIEARNSGPGTVADILNLARTTEKIPAHLNSAEEIARWLIKDSENGRGLRSLNDYLAYDEFGNRIVDGMPGVKAWDDAAERLIQVQLRDAADHLGAKVDPTTGAFSWDTQYNPLLDKLGYGRRVTLADLSKIDDKVRPKELTASVYVPFLGGRISKMAIVDQASKLYSFTVARPLQRLAINPIYLANKNIAYRELGPAAEEFITKGIPAKDTAAILEHAANKYAIATTFRYTDQTAERSFFSEITENFLMFNRASEDFLRRFSKVASANPAILSKAYLLMEAANHSGMIYSGPPQDDDGDGQNDERHLMFTFPGSALMAKAIQEVGAGLGFVDTDLVTTPLYSSMSSQVRYVNPSLSNPFGFSTSPMIGFPLRVARWYFPKYDSQITNTLGRLEGGGERFFAEQGVIQSLMPTPIARLVPAITQDEEDGQLASSIRNAFVYFGAAGLVPDDDATADQKEEAHEAIKDMATNQLIWRAVVGTFSPWAPQYDAPKGTGLPDPNPVLMARGLNNIRGEWFDVIREAAAKVGGEAAMGEASKEWFRRHPDGQSILNPGAFLTGTTDNPGNAGEAANVASGKGLTQWMMENKQWLKDNQSVAYYLLPNYLEPQYSAQGMRDQLRNGLREHRDGADFYAEMRYQVAMREYWKAVDKKNNLIGAGNTKRQVNAAFKEWETAFWTMHPATKEENDRRQDPGYVKGTLAPALGRMVESGKAPAGVDLAQAKQVWDWYNAYQTQYNKTIPGNKGKNARYNLNEQYREQGNTKFLGTAAHDLWKAMDIYEDGS